MGRSRLHKRVPVKLKFQTIDKNNIMQTHEQKIYIDITAGEKIIGFTFPKVE